MHTRFDAEPLAKRALSPRSKNVLRLGSIHSNLAALTRTTSAIDRALRRLSTGNRVARPGDDIVAYSQSAQLDSQVRGIYAGLTGLRTERSQTELADNAISSQLEIVQRMREIALQASNSLISATDRAALETELKSLLKDFERFT